MTILSTRATVHIFRHFKRVLSNWQACAMTEEMPASRDNPVITKLDTPEFHFIFTPELNILADLFKKHNYQLRIVGGAVRDILMGMKPKDLDFATNATPDQMKEMFTMEDIRMINNKGEKHGTITPRINDKQNFEVTTLRIDVLTNGRHAKVEFTTDWKLDALRRDLTINSMFLDLEGYLYDYFFGYEDLRKRRIVFVGNPNTRIKEDYLRIFRYFRFYGRIAQRPDDFEENTIRAIKENVHGLECISGERIWSEWSKILTGNYVLELTLKMLECGIARYIGLPENPDTAHFEEVYTRAVRKGYRLRPISLLCTMLRDECDVMNLHTRLKLSSYDRDLALFIIRHREDKPSREPLKPYTKIIVHWKGKQDDVKAFVRELLLYKGYDELLQEFDTIHIPRFPITGYMLAEHVTNRKSIGVIISKLKDIWHENDFRNTQEELMKEVPRIVCEIEER